MTETEGQTRLLAPWRQEFFTVSIIFESPDSQIDIEDWIDIDITKYN